MISEAETQKKVERLRSLVAAQRTDLVLKEMAAYFAEAVEKTPGRNLPLAALGEGVAYSFASVGQMTEALETYRHVERLSPSGDLLYDERIRRLNVLRMIKAGQGDYPGVADVGSWIIQEAEKLEGSPGARKVYLVSGYGARGQARLMIGDRAGAVSDYQEARRIFDTVPQDLHYACGDLFILQILLARGNPTRTFKATSDALASITMPKKPLPGGSDADAITEMIKSIVTYHQAILSEFNAKALAEMNPKLGAERLEALVDHPNSNVPAYKIGNRLSLAEVYLKLGRRADAEEQLRLAIVQMDEVKMPESHSMRAEIDLASLDAQTPARGAATVNRVRSWRRDIEVLGTTYQWSGWRTGLSGMSVAADFAHYWSESGWLLDSPAGSLALADTILSRWGAVRDAQMRVLALVHRGTRDPRLSGLIDRYRSAALKLEEGRSQIVGLASEDLFELQRAESELDAGLSGAGYERMRNWDATTEGVRKQLKRGEAFIQFVRLKRSSLSSETHFAAIVIRPTAARFIWLDTERRLSKLALRWTNRFSAKTSKRKRPPDPSMELFRELLGKPLGNVAQVGKLYVVPDGELGRVNLAALYGKDRRSLALDTEVCFLGAAQDLILEDRRIRAGNSFAFINPAYRTWEPISETIRHAEALRAYDPRAETLSGTDVSVTRISALRSPWVLHLACHGEARAVEQTGDWLRDSVELFECVRLVMAEMGESARDLSPARAAMLDLRNTELVFLSACETSLGGALPAEGLFGLRRAFRIAGARNVVTAVFPIPAEEGTERFVRRYYKELRRSRSPSAALHATQRAFLREPAYAAFRDPAYWAGFTIEARRS